MVLSLRRSLKNPPLETLSVGSLGAAGTGDAVGGAAGAGAWEGIWGVVIIMRDLRCVFSLILGKRPEKVLKGTAAALAKLGPESSNEEFGPPGLSDYL
jgi:hypothetical protein